MWISIFSLRECLWLSTFVGSLNALRRREAKQLPHESPLAGFLPNLLSTNTNRITTWSKCKTVQMNCSQPGGSQGKLWLCNRVLFPLIGVRAGSSPHRELLQRAGRRRDLAVHKLQPEEQQQRPRIRWLRCSLAPVPLWRPVCKRFQLGLRQSIILVIE